MANTSPAFFEGQVPSVSDWQGYFSAKVDAVNGALSGGSLDGGFSGSPTWSGQHTFTGSPVFSAQLSGQTFDAAAFIATSPVGSGTNGPSHAQVGLKVDHNKVNWQTASAAVGEIDGIYITVRQGGTTSDSSGLLVDLASTGTGYTAPIETVCTKYQTTTLATLTSIRTQDGVLNNGASPQYYGRVTLAEAGNLTAALYVANTPTAGYWGHVLENWKDGTRNITIVDDGSIITQGIIQINSGSTGYLNVQANLGTGNTFGSGSFLMWNRGSGDGATYLLNQKGGGAGGIFIQEMDTSGTGTTRVGCDANGNVYIGQAAVATNATNGFFYIPSCAGAPVGTPTAKSGRSPMVFDSTNSKFWIYAGSSWKGIALA